MTNEMFYSVTDGHLKLLAEVGVLKYIIANKGCDVQVSITYICLTLLTRAKCGVRSTLCWKIPNISGSIELFAL